MPYNAIDLVYNPLPVTIPFPAGYGSPEKLRYLVELYVPQAADSTVFVKLSDLEARHAPAKDGVYPDAKCQVQDYLKKQFADNPPVDNGILVRLPGALLPYYIRYKRDPFDANWTTLPTRYALQGGLSYSEFPGNVFMTEILAITKQFLTWQPRIKTVQPGQPEYLDFLVNFSGVTSLKLMVRTYLPDGSTATVTKATTGGIAENSIYRCAVGPDQLGLAADVVRYDIWLANQSDAVISETRSFTLEPRYRRNVKYLLFRNSLGAYDTLRLTGQSLQTISAKSETVQRFLPPGYIASDGEFQVNEVSAERTLEVSTGHLRKDYYNYLQELFLSKQIYLKTERALLPYSLLTKDLQHWIDDETLFGLKLRLKAGYTELSYSNLPSLTFTSTKQYTANCPAGQNGTPVTKSATATSTVSQADADAKALSKAQVLAESELVCSFAADGTFIRTQCKPTTTELWTIVADGSGGERYGQLINAQATECGYVPPVSFIATPLGAGQVKLDNLTGGDPNANFEWSYNQIDWQALPGAGGYNNPRTVTLPVGGLVTLSVRRGTASMDMDILLPSGTTFSSPTLVLNAQNNYLNPFLAPSELRLLIQNPVFGGPMPADAWIHYSVSRKVDSNPVNNVPIKKGWFHYTGSYDEIANHVIIDVITAGTQYDIVPLAAPIGWKMQSTQLTM